VTDPSLIIPPGTTLPPMEPTPIPQLPGRGQRRILKPAGKPGRRAGAVKRRFGLLNAIADEALPTLKGRGEVAAWLVLFRHAKPNGIAVVSVSDLARRIGATESTAKRALCRLREVGLVERIKRGSLASGASVWRLLLPAGGQP